MTGRMCRWALMMALLVVMIGIAAVVAFDAERAAPGATEGLFVRPFFWLWIAVFGVSGARGSVRLQWNTLRWWHLALTGAVLVAAADTLASFWLSVRCCGGFVAECLTLPLLVACAVALVAATFFWGRRS